ncbi:MAG TPA: hypothetical protein VHB99_03095, partial [Pirellulales bacterium]|nr:hypothetical protein [Pirellulales bacterium]
MELRAFDGCIPRIVGAVRAETPLEFLFLQPLRSIIAFPVGQAIGLVEAAFDCTAEAEEAALDRTDRRRNAFPDRVPESANLTWHTAVAISKCAGETSDACNQSRRASASEPQPDSACAAGPGRCGPKPPTASNSPEPRQSGRILRGSASRLCFTNSADRPKGVHSTLNRVDPAFDGEDGVEHLHHVALPDDAELRGRPRQLPKGMHDVIGCRVDFLKLILLALEGSLALFFIGRFDRPQGVELVLCIGAGNSQPRPAAAHGLGVFHPAQAFGERVTWHRGPAHCGECIEA